MRSRYGSNALIASVVFLVGGSTASFAQRPKEREKHPEVESLVFHGVHEAATEEISQSIATTASHCAGIFFKPFCWISHNHHWFKREYLNHAELAKDVLRIRVFYWKRGFRDAEVDTAVVDRGNGKVRVELTVREGQPTRVGRFIVQRPESLISERAMGRLLRLKENAPLNLLRLDTTVANITNALWDRGHADAIVDTSIVVDTAAKRADVTIRIDPRWVATVGVIRVKGNEEVPDALIRRIIRLNTGDLYRRQDVIESQRSLFESGLFRRTQIVIPPQGDSIKSIDLSVTEAPPRLARVSSGFNTADFGLVDGRFTNFNFLGRGRRLDVQASAGNLFAQQLNGAFIFRDITRGLSSDDRTPFLQPTYLASVNVQERWFGSPKNTLGLSAFAHRRSAPNIYIDRGFGSEVSFTRELTRRAPLSALYRFEVTRVEAGDVYYCVNYGVCDVATIGALRDRQRLSPLALTAAVATFDDPIDPSTGYQLKGEIEHASSFTLSDFRYNRLFADGAVYRNMGLRRVLAGHLRAGYSRALQSSAVAVGVGPGSTTLFDVGILHPRKRFYAGGSQSVRGYGENMLGPQVLTIAPSKLVRRVDDNGVVVFPGCADSVSHLTAANVQNCGALLNAAGLTDGDFVPRPSGGSALLEGSVEYRFPIFNGLTGAAFVDGAIVGQGSFRASRASAAITPGFGVRYYTAVGPIRFDVGYNPRLSENLPVVTEVTDSLPDGSVVRRIVEIEGGRRVFPTQKAFNFRSIFDRMTLHFSIGQAF